MKQGKATLNQQDKAAIAHAIEQMELQIRDLRTLAATGYTSIGITSTTSGFAAHFDGGHSWQPTRYRPLSGIKSDRYDSEGNSACVSGGDVSTLEEHLDAIFTELKDGTYPGFVEGPVERTGEDALRDAAAIDAVYGKTYCSGGDRCECDLCRPGDPDDYLK